jgi:hypothetical protein
VQIFVIVSGSALAQDIPVANDEAMTLPSSTGNCMRPVQCAFQEISEKWEFELCYEDAVLAPGMAPAPGVALSVYERSLVLADIEKLSGDEAAAAVLLKSDAQSPMLKFKMLDIGGCPTATPTERLSSDGVTWEPVSAILDRTIDLGKSESYNAALVQFEAAVDKTGIQLTLFLQSGPYYDGPCSVVSGLRPAREVLGDILQCAPSTSEYFYLMTVDGTEWVLSMSHATPPEVRTDK